VTSNSEMLEEIEKLMSRNHYCILATASGDGRPQSTGVIYCSKGLDLYVYSDPHSKKARNIVQNPNVAVTIPVWGHQLFWVPPRSIQFQGVADILPADDPVANEAYKFKVLFMEVSISNAKGCFVHIRPTKRISTYGVGVPRMTMARHPEEANRRTRIP
jgi:nitroimidazol reductase NimA-like FMN-containing flavoprotein (pyridoxamine 5'-phosphate oxidase superfamily)